MKRPLDALFNYPAPLWWLWSVPALVFTILAVLLWSIVLALGGLAGAPRKWQTFLIRLWSRIVITAIRGKVEVVGRENDDPRKPVLISSNHQSLYDIPLTFLALGGDIRMVAKQELFKIPIFGQCLTGIETIPVNRSDRESGRAAAERIRAKIQSGLRIWVAPEGTRSKTKELGPFKKGSFAMAIEAGVPVQPLVIVNSHDILPKKALLPRTGVTIRMLVLPLISTEGLKPEQRGELADRVRTEMVSTLERLNNK